MDDYDRLFSFEEKKIFTIDVPNSKNIYGLKQDAMPEIYNQARVFSLFSDVEGESRVIAEALVCGIPVVVKKHLMGGGRDYLNDKNSKLFSSIDESVDAFLHVLNNYHQYEFDALTYQKELREDYTIPKLKKTIQQYYKNNNLVFKGCLNVENLTRQLPSHVVSLPMRLLKKESRTNDLKSPLAVVGFIKFLLKKDFSSYYVFYSFVATVWVIHKIAIFVKVIIKNLFYFYCLPFLRCG